MEPFLLFPIFLWKCIIFYKIKNSNNNNNLNN